MKEAKWIHIRGVATPGGDPYYECSNCGHGRCYGVEHPESLEEECPWCNATMIMTVDALKAVKCKYCKHCEIDDETGYAYCDAWQRGTQVDWYCSRGKQK